MTQHRIQQINNTQKATKANMFFGIVFLTFFLFLFVKTAKSQIVSTYIDTTGIAGYNGDNISAKAARFNIPFDSYAGGIALDNSGNLYIADYKNHRIRKIDKTTKIITTVAGTGIGGYNGDGILATSAQLFYPGSVAFDAANNMYISDCSNWRIRKVDAITGIITTYAGYGIIGNSSTGNGGDGGLATNCQFAALSYLTIDGNNNLYFVDNYRIRKIDATTHIVTAFAGQISSGFSNDVPVLATSTYFGGVICGILADAVGNVYVTDYHRVRKIQGGYISTVIGHYWDNGQLFGGDNGPATNAYFTSLFGMCWGVYGELYVCDRDNNLIRKYNPTTGVITTVAGDITTTLPFLHGGFNGDGNYATQTKFLYTTSVAVNAAGEMFILDVGNNRVRKISPPCTPIIVNKNVTVCASAVPYHWAGMSLTTTGNYTVHQTLASGCDSSATLHLTVLGTMPPITGATSVCVGSSIQLSDSFVGGNWTSLVGRASVNSSGLVTGVFAGTATIRYSFTNELGCNATALYNVNVYSTPSVPSIQYAAGTTNPQIGAGGGNNYCSGRTFTVIGTPSGGVWSSSGVITVGASTGIVNTGSVAGTGSVTYTTTINGCSNSKTINGTIVACPTPRGYANDNGQMIMNSEFTMYPNPAKTFINLSLNSFIGAGTIEITDLYGKQVKTQSLSLGSNTINISSLSKGFYLVNVFVNNTKQTKKLIIE